MSNKFYFILFRYMSVIEEIADIIDQFDEKLMTDKRSLTLQTFHTIYRLKHDLLHLRILCTPLKDIIYRLQRTTDDEQFFLSANTEPALHLGMKHHIIRRQLTSCHGSSHTTMNLKNQSTRQTKKTSIFFNENIYIYLSDLNDHINQLIDSLELQRESVSALVSFWLTLNNNETQETLKILMLISVLFMPGILLVGINSTNFKTQPQLHYEYSYYIVLAILAGIITGMTTWYRLKQWI